jgi:hypothetical protein
MLDLATAPRAGFSIKAPQFCDRMPITSIPSDDLGSQSLAPISLSIYCLKRPAVMLYTVHSRFGAEVGRDAN